MRCAIGSFRSWKPFAAGQYEITGMKKSVIRKLYDALTVIEIAAERWISRIWKR